MPPVRPPPPPPSATHDELMSLLPTLMLGKPSAFDFAITSPLISNNLPEAYVTARSAAFVPIEVRTNQSNYGKCVELGWVSISIVVETYRCCTGVQSQVGSITAARCSTMRHNCPKTTATASLYERLSSGQM